MRLTIFAMHWKPQRARCRTARLLSQASQRRSCHSVSTMRHRMVQPPPQPLCAGKTGVTGAAFPATHAKNLNIQARKTSGKRSCSALVLPVADLGAFLPDCESSGTAPLATVLAYGDEAPTLSRAGRLGIAHHAPERLPMALERIAASGESDLDRALGLDRLRDRGSQIWRSTRSPAHLEKAFP